MPAGAQDSSFQNLSFNSKYLVSTYSAPGIRPQTPASNPRGSPSPRRNPIPPHLPPLPDSSGLLLGALEPDRSQPGLVSSSQAKRDRPGCSQCLRKHRGMVSAKRQRADVSVTFPQVTAHWNFNRSRLWLDFKGQCCRLLEEESGGA